MIKCYIVTEDSESGLQFWQAIKKTILADSNKVTVLSSHGAGRMAEKSSGSRSKTN